MSRFYYLILNSLEIKQTLKLLFAKYRSSNSATVAVFSKIFSSLYLTLDIVSLNFYNLFELFIKNFNEKTHFCANQTSLNKN